MTTKILSTYAAGGYTLSPSYSELDITATGGVGGNGVSSNHFATISNAGTIRAFFEAVSLNAGGVVINRAGGYIGGYFGVGSNTSVAVTNDGTIRASGDAIYGLSGGSVFNGSYASEGATIAGGAIVLTGAPGTVTKLGTISAEVYLGGGGTVTNGGVGDTTALINGTGGILITGGAGTVNNFGTIETPGVGANGVNLGSGGRVTNGAVTDTAARIEGFTGVRVAGAAGTVTNFGVIDGTGVVNGAYGAALSAGGVVINGGATDQAALIEGYIGVRIGGFAGTVTNFGTIRGFGASGSETGLYLAAGGLVTNGSADDTAALIEGAYGVFLNAAGTIVNFGAVHGATGSGVQLNSGGRLTNGGGGDRSALIEGYSVGVEGFAAATVNNFGTVQATGAYGLGVALFAGGTAVNGSLNNGSAMIEGYTGLELYGAAAATNFGTISGVGDFGGFGAFLGDGAHLTNGAAGHAKAVIEGFEGIYTPAAGTADTVTNFGTIIGAGGTAVQFRSSTDTLIVEAGCAFDGSVLGGGGTLDLDTGVGTLTGLLAGGSVTVSGSMAPTTFQDFATVAIGAAATFNTSGAVTLVSGQVVNDLGVLTLGSTITTVVNGGLIETSGSGALTIKGLLTNTGVISAGGGTFTVKGAVTGNGSATIGGGLMDFVSSFTENVTFTGGAGTLELAQSQGYTGSVTGFSKSGGTFLDLLDIAFGGGTTASYSGNKKSGVLTVTDGTHTAHIALKGNYLSSTFIVASDGLGGTLVHDPAAPVAALPPWVAPGADQRFIAAIAGLTSRAGSCGYAVREPWRAAGSSLTAPRMHFA